jgi:hypothetical protein
MKRKAIPAVALGDYLPSERRGEGLVAVPYMPLIGIPTVFLPNVETDKD